MCFSKQVGSLLALIDDLWSCQKSEPSLIFVKFFFFESSSPCPNEPSSKESICITLCIAGDPAGTLGCLNKSIRFCPILDT